MSTAADLVASISRLASLPEAYLRVKRVLDDPDSGLMELTEAISVDPAMTARLLRVVNSPFYGFSRRVDTVYRAVNVLGMQQAHDLVLAWAIGSAFANVQFNVIPMQDFWLQSVATAIAARTLAKSQRFIDAERLFIEGLLADIGHLVMYAALPGQSIKARHESHHTGRPLAEVEREVIGTDFAEIGAVLVVAWDLPSSFQEPIACQLTPENAVNHPLEAAILSVSSALAISLDNPQAAGPSEAALSRLQIDDSMLETLCQQMRLERDGIVATFFPQLKVA
ncbi:MAG TPA: HDOD domain-containing protein [Accumulibacter sp.]|nr:HDOD domain-containing protein [Accumulibacter sp.]HMW18869.1 HDOD domain-containing protein [Accumulibacter sp.]HMX23934.1 HDOD domain-containing protein [Accumulibacter sp.]HMY07682.1 HDOD domain-containing protein [Accumulibacter sp.]HNC18912.1 HDOD domain-containing protein [Accumulibacter sp.]